MHTYTRSPVDLRQKSAIGTWTYIQAGSLVSWIEGITIYSVYHKRKLVSSYQSLKKFLEICINYLSLINLSVCRTFTFKCIFLGSQWQKNLHFSTWFSLVHIPHCMMQYNSVITVTIHCISFSYRYTGFICSCHLVFHTNNISQPLL